MIELKECPNCGCTTGCPEDTAGLGFQVVGEHTDSSVYVVCSNCGLSGPRVFVPGGNIGDLPEEAAKEAAKLWNALPRQRFQSILDLYKERIKKKKVRPSGFTLIDTMETVGSAYIEMLTDSLACLCYNDDYGEPRTFFIEVDDGKLLIYDAEEEVDL